MKLYEQWNQLLASNDANAVNEYLDNETAIYRQLLANKQSNIKGTIKELADHYDVTPMLFIGFLDGINESLEVSHDLSEVTEETNINATIHFEQLLMNMYKVKADWLYSLDEWDNIYSVEERKKIRQAYFDTITAKSNKIGRNEPCPCGSGKKYKKCCGS